MTCGGPRRGPARDLGRTTAARCPATGPPVLWEASLSLKGLGERRVDRATGKIKLDLREVKQVQVGTLSSAREARPLATGWVAAGRAVPGEPGRQVPGAPGPGVGRGEGALRGDAPCLVSDWPREQRAFPARPAASLAPLSCAHAHLALATPTPTPTKPPSAWPAPGALWPPCSAGSLKQQGLGGQGRRAVARAAPSP